MVNAIGGNSIELMNSKSITQEALSNLVPCTRVLPWYGWPKKCLPPVAIEIP